MSDIVERLPADLKGRDEICNSYADENQRLSDEIERLRNIIWEAAGDAVRSANEIMRLRFALGPSVSWSDEMKKREDEIERLRAALAPLVEHFSVGGSKPIGKMLQDARRALAQSAPWVNPPDSA